MYAAYRDGIEPKCRESFSLPRILVENLLYLTTWSVAGALVWPVRVAGWPVLTLAWALVVVVVQVLLKKHNCSGCYYYGKACHLAPIRHLLCGPRRRRPRVGKEASGWARRRGRVTSSTQPRSPTPPTRGIQSRIPE